MDIIVTLVNIFIIFYSCLATKISLPLLINIWEHIPVNKWLYTFKKDSTYALLTFFLFNIIPINKWLYNYKVNKLQ